MVDPRGALEDEEEEDDEGGEDWEDMPERDSGRFDMVMNMIPGEHSKHSKHPLKLNALQHQEAQVEDLAPPGALIALVEEAGAGECGT